MCLPIYSSRCVTVRRILRTHKTAFTSNFTSSPGCVIIYISIIYIYGPWYESLFTSASGDMGLHTAAGMSNYLLLHQGTWFYIQPLVRVIIYSHSFTSGNMILHTAAGTSHYLLLHQGAWLYIRPPVRAAVLNFIICINNFKVLRMFHSTFGLLDWTCPHGLIFTWRGCRGLCLWPKPTALAHSFWFCSCVRFCLFSRQLPLPSHSLLWISFCLIGPFNYTPLPESLPQPWYNPLRLTVFKAPAN